MVFATGFHHVRGPFVYAVDWSDAAVAPQNAPTWANSHIANLALTTSSIANPSGGDIVAIPALVMLPRRAFVHPSALASAGPLDDAPSAADQVPDIAARMQNSSPAVVSHAPSAGNKFAFLSGPPPDGMQLSKGADDPAVALLPPSPVAANFPRLHAGMPQYPVLSLPRRQDSCIKEFLGATRGSADPPERFVVSESASHETVPQATRATPRRNQVSSRGWAGYDSLRDSARGAIDRLSGWLSGTDHHRLGAATFVQEDEPPTTDEVAGPGGLPLGMFQREEQPLQAPPQSHATVIMDETTTVCKNGHCHTVTKHLRPTPLRGNSDLAFLPFQTNLQANGVDTGSGIAPIAPLSRQRDAIDPNVPSRSFGHFVGQTEAKW